MRKITIIATALAAVLCAASCSNVDVQSPASESRIITCDFGGADTKTSLDATNKTVWNTGDEILLLSASDPYASEKITVTSEYNGKTSFSFATALPGTLRAIYPASVVTSWNEMKAEYYGIDFAKYKYQDGDFGKANIATAQSDGSNTLSFHNVGSIMKISVSSSDYASVKISTGYNPFPKCMEITDYSHGSTNPRNDDAFDGITVYTPSAGDYYVAVPPGFNMPSGSVFTVTKSDGTRASRTTTSPVSTTKGDLMVLPTVEEISSTLSFNSYIPVGFVDLGLDILWAEKNLGASSIEGSGGFYAWGETAEKEVYSLSTYSFYADGAVTKYNSSDEHTVLMPDDDAATVASSAQRMPTYDEMMDLISGRFTTVTEDTVNTVKGFRITGPNGNSIFLPYAGYKEGSVLEYSGQHLYYWTSTVRTSDNCLNAYALNTGFYASMTPIQQYVNGSSPVLNAERGFGLCIRPVRD